MAEHQAIVFDLQHQEHDKSALEEERDKHRARAERFGTHYQDPAQLPKFRQEARRERFKREGFATGIDLFSEEEIAKRAARAKKFGLPEDRATAVAYAPDPEDAKRAARAKKFGVKYEQPTPDSLLQKQDLFEPRRDAPEDIPRRETAIYLYGVDILSTSDVLMYFDEYAPTLVEWINDSSCCVVFEDAATTCRAIAGSGHPLAPEELSSAPDSMDVAMAGVEPGQMQFLWHKGHDFIKGKDDKGKDHKVPLMYRMATDLDQKDPHADKRSRFLWKGKRRYEDYQQQRQQGQQHGKQHGRHKQQHQAGEQDQGGQQQLLEHPGDEDENMRQVGKRGDRKLRQRLQRLQQAGQGNADEEMLDAEGDMDDKGSDAAVPGAQDLRELLKQRDASRRLDDEDLPYEEVPQPPSDVDEGDAALQDVADE